ncbi:MAG: tetratricopeptide repeat protein [Actinomycetota bacterium]
MTVDRWGMDIGGSAESIAAWNEAWDRFLSFTGDPLELLAHANEHDDEFVMGSVMQGVYALTSGSPLDAPAVRTAVERATVRDGGPHAEALVSMAAGDFTAAGDAFAALGAEGDFAAYRFAHDIFLHVADAERRLAWSDRSIAHGFADGQNFIDGMHSFTLNEVGRHDEAVEFGERALAVEPRDLWARHALAHVYEDRDDREASFPLLEATSDDWREQDALALHVWWHLALRYLAVGRYDDAVTLYDARVDDATTPFRLCDLTSLLWRLELRGQDVGDRWDVLADRWAQVGERHTCGFLDLHATFVFVRRPDHPGAAVWFDGLAARPDGDAEIDDIFEQVAKPLVAAIRNEDAAALDNLAPTLHRIGGSNAQRSVVSLTAGAWR